MWSFVNFFTEAMKTLLTLRRDGKEWLLIEGDPLGLVGGDHMVRVVMLGRCWASSHCRPQADPQSNVWGWVGSGSPVDVGLGSVVGSHGEQHAEQRTE